MEIIYQGDEIINVTIGAPLLESRLTKAERIAFFGCDAPDQVVWAAVSKAERGQDTVENAVAAMVSEGLITQQRADEILA